MLSVQCTGTVVRCTRRGKIRSGLCRRFLALSCYFYTRPNLHRTLSGPIVSAGRGLTLMYATTSNGNGSAERFIRFVALMLQGEHRKCLRFVDLVCLSLCQGLGRVKMNGLVATIPISGRARSHVHSTTTRVLRTRVRLRAIMSPSVRNKFVFSVGSCQLSTDVTARLGQMGRRFVSGGEEVMWYLGVLGWTEFPVCYMGDSGMLVPVYDLAGSMQYFE